ncbi:tRNA(Ile)-lysidine synthase [Rubripirellula tenax]|uniref:tRNA(Ile)-lysidine synthase n=1 Tax=Rubripirellula tenax TaxID=2528015 RepID=A0A5C6FI36_9BACT|nr:tRNA lysidine(34) synthetase TilS [Rubripirellula tenax]TWU59817.1 tRNA(Ile)-lysidine synthase [Rubripirellula tenax]
MRIDPFIERLVAAWPPPRWTGVGVVVGCSGGADSVGLLCGLNRIAEQYPNERGFLVAAHFNHGLRGEASDGDEQSVRELAESLSVRFASRRATDQDSDEAPKSDEASLRSARTQFLIETAKSYGCRYIAVAHSADDNVETVLHNLMRGTGPAGLAGIAAHRSIDQDLVLVRPLIDVRRVEIRDFLGSIGQPWREDASNQEVVYQRNWIRRELIPMIETRYPDASEAIGRATAAQRDWRSFIESAAQDWVERQSPGGEGAGGKRAGGQGVGGEQVAVNRDFRTEPAVVIAGLQLIWDARGWPRGEMTRDHWRRLADTVAGGSDERYTLPGKIDVRPVGDCIWFAVCSV